MFGNRAVKSDTKRKLLIVNDGSSRRRRPGLSAGSTIWRETSNTLLSVFISLFLSGGMLVAAQTVPQGEGAVRNRRDETSDGARVSA